MKPRNHTARIAMNGLLAFACAQLVLACAHSAKKNEGPPTAQPTGAVQGPPSPIASPSPVTGAVFGPPSQQGPAPVYGPEKIALRPAVLLFGPGGARAFAHLGVLRALQEAHVPVAAVAGTELGGLVAAIYAQEGSLNHLEWGLLQFNDVSLGAQGGVLSRLISRRKAEFDSSLRKVLGDADLAKMKMPARIVLCLKSDAECPVAEKGKAAEAVRAGMADDKFLGSSRWNGKDATTAAARRPFPVRELSALGPVIAVDLGTVSSGDLKDADVVIKPDLGEIGVNDFAKKTDAAYKGKVAAEEMMKEIRHYVGLPEEPTP